MFRLQHAANTDADVLLAKSIIGGAFAVLTLCGMTLPALGVEFTVVRELLATSAGGLIGATLVLLRA